MKLKTGDRVAIGDSIVVIQQTKGHQVSIAIKARRSTPIKKLA